MNLPGFCLGCLSPFARQDKQAGAGCRPDWEACGRLAASVVDASPLCPDGTCILADTISQQKADFYALTGEGHIILFLVLTKKIETVRSQPS